MRSLATRGYLIASSEMGGQSVPMDNIAHALVGAALGRAVADRHVRLAGWLGAVAANAPDWTEFFIGLPAPAHPDQYLVLHRGITHSLVFAVGGAVVATALLFRAHESRMRVALVLGLAFLSHSLLDGLSSYSSGIAYFAPFSSQRFRLWWTPLGDPEGQLAGQLIQEAFVVFLPAFVLGWLALRVRRRA